MIQCFLTQEEQMPDAQAQYYIEIMTSRISKLKSEEQTHHNTLSLARSKRIRAEEELAIFIEKLPK